MTQVGEGICLPPTLAEPWEFDAHVEQVRFTTRVVTSVVGANVSAAHWTQADAATIPADWAATARSFRFTAAGPVRMSSRPAVYSIAAGAARVEVTLVVTRSVNVSGEGTLAGTIGGLRIEGRFPTAAGTHTVSAQFTTVPGELTVLRGDIAWGVEVPDPGFAQAVGSSFAEVYFVFDAPKRPFATAVPAEVLRFLFGRIGVARVGTALDAAKRITAACHSSLGMRYDVVGGASSYLTGGSPAAAVSFDLTGYMRRDVPTVNCYDQAAAVQAFCAALGIATTYIFMEPYGFIRPTRLVGWPQQCNNPFFQANNTRPLVAPDDPMRTPFGNHAFVRSAGKILDACAGPYLAAGDLRDYVTAAIDPRRYPRNRYSTDGPGTVADARDTVGVASAS
jgi:hypothetical protein